MAPPATPAPGADPASAHARRAAVEDPARLAAVRATGLLDGPPDPALDRWVRLAARALGTPVALLTLVDADRDFVTAHVGLPAPLADAREVRAAPSFCQDAVSRQQARRAARLAEGAAPGDAGALPPPVVVPDAAADPLYRTFPSVQHLGVRASVTAPILGAGGHALGSLCVLDFAPRAWTAEQVDALHDLAHAAAAEMALRTAGVAAAARAAELADTAAAERRARAAAEAANATKSHFLRTVSHELRTPLQATLGYSALLLEGVAGPVTPQQADYLRRIRAGSDHLLVLINDLLGFARVEAGQVEIRPRAAPVADLLDAAAALFAAQAEGRGVTVARLAVLDGLHAWADADRLTQIVGNLVTNAVKFTDAGGRVELGAALDGADVRLWVRDTGRGIPADELERVFEPFVQVDRHLTAAPQQGVGLGLAIARDLARRMGGDLVADSRVGEGSTFTVRVPAAGAMGVPGEGAAA